MTESRQTARNPDSVFKAELALMGFTKDERDQWEEERALKMLDLYEQGYTMGCIARASGYSVSRVSDFVERARALRVGS